MSDLESCDPIELRVENIAQLFHTLDPFPFRERDLDKEAEEFIVGWARELPTNHAITILVHPPEAAAQTSDARQLKGGVQGYFSRHAEATQRSINELFRIGRRSLHPLGALYSNRTAAASGSRLILAEDNWTYVTSLVA